MPLQTRRQAAPSHSLPIAPTLFDLLITIKPATKHSIQMAQLTIVNLSQALFVPSTSRENDFPLVVLFIHPWDFGFPLLPGTHFKCQLVVKCFMHQTIGIAQETRRKTSAKENLVRQHDDKKRERDGEEKVFKHSFLQKAQCRNNNNL